MHSWHKTLIKNPAPSPDKMQRSPKPHLRQSVDRLKALLLMPLMILPCALEGTGILEGFELVWADEFDYEGAPDPEKWTHELGGGGWGNAEVQIYTDSLNNARVEGGRLIIEAHQTLGGRTPGYTSARLITREKDQWKYGRMEVRAKLPVTTGTWPAIWMLAADTLHSSSLWPDNGEIDIMEHVGYEEDPLFRELKGDPELPNLHGTVHTKNRNGRDNQGIGGSTYLPEATTAFHTYAINWFEDRIEWEIDGENFFTFPRSSVVSTRNPPEDPSPFWPFDQRFFMILNIAVGGTWGGHFNSNFYPQSPYGPDGIDHEGEWPQRMEIEFVRVYSYPAQTEPTLVPGIIRATAMDHDNGILIETSTNEESPHNLSRIDAGDYAEFVIQANQSGRYRLSAALASPSSGKSLSLEIPETSSMLSGITVPNTGGWQNWQTVDLGEMDLKQGENTLRLTTPTGGFNLAWLRVGAATGGIWKGLVIDEFGNANTESWLGWINVTADPWIFSYSLNNWIYPEAVTEPVFHTNSQWIYVFNP